MLLVVVVVVVDKVLKRVPKGSQMGVYVKNLRVPSGTGLRCAARLPEAHGRCAQGNDLIER